VAALRILHALVAPGRGGAEAMALALALAHRRRGHDVTILLFSTSPFAADAAAAGVPVRVEPVASSLDARGWWRVARVLAALGPDVVHCHGTSSLVPVAWARTRGRLGGRVVYTRHGNAVRLGRPRLTHTVHAALERWLFGSVDAVACVNEELRAADLERFPWLPVELIVNGVDVQAFAPAGPADRAAVRAALGLPAFAPLVVSTSRLVPIKGVDVLIDAWGRVTAAQPGAHLVVAGDGECRGTLEARVQQAGLGASVHLVGSIADVARLVGAADVFVFPSVRGCFGRSAIEALASGTPVVTSRLDGTERFVTDGETARLVPPGQPAPLATAITGLLAGEAERVALGRRARALAEARYSVDGMALAYEALYARVASHGSPVG
jgi:glycosyltransferase involved in cell wall biosynthesis